MRDLNETNSLLISSHSQSVSSEDYFLSICHLAHPTFPTRDVSPNNINTQQLDTVHQRLRLARHNGITSTTSEFNPTEEPQDTEAQQGVQKELGCELMFGNSDPLEYLYGHQNNLSEGMRRVFAEGRFTRQYGSKWEGQVRTRAHSILCASTPDLPRQTKSNCPEFQTSTNNSALHISPKHSLSRLEVRRGTPVVVGAEGERQNPTIKQSFISQWISECRSAWREARVRACMLPAIAEI